jgi:hypothetical protein
MKLIKNETKLFNYIDPDFENWNVDEGVTDSVPLKAVKQGKDFTFKEVFNDTHYCSQEDVIKWVEENKEEIKSTNYNYFFLLKNKEGARFIAYVFEWRGELEVRVDELSHDSVWSASNGDVVLFPQTNKPLETHTPSNLEPMSLEQAIEICKSNGLKVFRTKTISEEL